MIINGINIEVEYKAIKHIHLAVYPPDGRVHVSAPKETTDAQLRMFVLSKWIWLIEKREEAIIHSIQSPREYVSGEAHYYKGDLYRLKVDVLPDQNPGVSIEGDYLAVCCRRQTQAEEVLKGWYRERLKEILEPLIVRWANRLDTPIPDFDVQTMQQRWGSCKKAEKRILFNTELAKKPLECIEYIVAHEVTHLIERNHTDRFFRLMDTHLPNWEKLKEQLNEFPITL